jgi:hypothetical protein
MVEVRVGTSKKKFCFIARDAVDSCGFLTSRKGKGKGVLPPSLVQMERTFLRNVGKLIEKKL